jgi:hypothetical protein
MVGLQASHSVSQSRSHLWAINGAFDHRFRSGRTLLNVGTVYTYFSDGQSYTFELGLDSNRNLEVGVRWGVFW